MICRTSPPREKFTRALCVDHNHATGQIRDLLCSQCNSAIAYAKENPMILRRMAEYIEQWLTPGDPDRTTKP